MPTEESAGRIVQDCTLVTILDYLSVQDLSKKKKKKSCPAQYVAPCMYKVI